MNQRVVVTGLGCISGAGKNVNELWHNVRNGITGIKEYPPAIEQDLQFNKAAFIPNYSAMDYFSAKHAKLYDRSTQYAVIAANEAILDAGIEISENSAYETGIVTGTCIGGQDAQDAGFKDLYQRQKKRIHPMTVPWIMPNAGACQISMNHGIKGPTFTTSTACSSSNHAIGQAFWLIKQGLIHTCITGGHETPLSYGFMKAWESLRVVSSDSCRPFSVDRSGLILGEGAGMIVLEDMDHAISRGASIYAEMVGFGLTADAGHLTKPDMNGALKAIDMAIQSAQIEPNQIDYMNAHGTGTLINDKTESEVIRTYFSDHADTLAVSSTKAVHGHALGATGAFEAIATIKAIRENYVPPTANVTSQDPACDINLIAETGRNMEINYAMSNALAFGGLNSVLVFKKWSS